MKQTYVKPNMEVVTFDSEVLMNTASGEQGSAGMGSGTANDKDPTLAGHRRGTWGNLWE